MQRTALVTGATAGFGAAICRTLIENGYRVIGTGRRVARLEQLQQEPGGGKATGTYVTENKQFSQRVKQIGNISKIDSTT